MINKANRSEGLRELADQQFQEHVWSGQVPGQMSSVPELVCEVFDDTGLSDALESGGLEAELGELHQFDGVQPSLAELDLRHPRLIGADPDCDLLP